MLFRSDAAKPVDTRKLRRLLDEIPRQGPMGDAPRDLEASGRQFTFCSGQKMDSNSVNSCLQ